MTRKNRNEKKEEEEPKAEPRPGLLRSAATAVAGIPTKVGAGIIAFIVGGLIVYFTGMLPDYGEFDVAEKRVTYPAKVEIDPIIEPRFFWPLHRARVMTEGFTGSLRPVGDTELVLPIVKERTPLSKILKPITFEPMGVGTTDLILRMRSAGGREIAEAAIRVIVERHVDYDGVWKMKIGTIAGTAYLHLVPHTDPNAEDVDVYGFFTGDDHATTGLVSGKFNGDKFVGHAIFGDMPTRWNLNADTRREGAGVVAQGKAEIYAPAPDGWTSVDANGESFTMTWQRPLPVS